MALMLEHLNDRIEETSDDSTGFLVAVLGGTGIGASDYFRSKHLIDGRRFRKHILQIDSEARAITSSADSKLVLKVNSSELRQMKANPQLFGPVCETMVEKYPEYIRRESLGSGSRTRRSVTQLLMELRVEELIAVLREAFLDLLSQGCSRIVPLFIGSSGGGMGSAAIPVLAWLMADEHFRQQVLEGLDESVLVESPSAMLMEPYALAIKNKRKQANKILANMYATRTEIAYLTREYDAFQYVFHIGLANKAAVMSSREEMWKQLGANAYAYCRNRDWLKARYVDTVDGFRDTCRYLGLDVPEYVVPEESFPPYVERPVKKSSYSRIRVTRHEFVPTKPK